MEVRIMSNYSLGEISVTLTRIAEALEKQADTLERIDSVLSEMASAEEVVTCLDRIKMAIQEKAPEF